MPGLSRPVPSPVEHPRYEFVKLLKEALFGHVALARDKESGELVAIRFFDNRLDNHGRQWIPLEDKDCLHGIVEQMRLHHPCVLDVKAAIAAPPYLGLVMEYAEGGEVWEVVARRGGLPEAEARALFQQVVLAMDYCQAKGATCKDMQLKHGFLAGGSGRAGRLRLKLRQFDYSALLQDLQGHFPPSRVGTMAPECITCLQGQVGSPADAWMAGVMLYSLLFGQHPFERPGDEKVSFARRVQIMTHRILEADYSVPASPPISEGCRDLLARLLVRDPAQRLPFAAIMEHEWFKQDLPADLLEAHRAALARPLAGGQSEEELRGIIDQVVAANAKAATA